MNDRRRAGRAPGPPAPHPKPSPPTAPLQVVPMGDGGRGAKPGDPRTSRKPGRPEHDAEAQRERDPQSSGETTTGRSASRGGSRRRRRRRTGSKLPDRAVVFVGPMAAGKTSLGKRVARELGVPFVDTDAVFVRRHGPITDFFAAHGEPEFRRLEAEVIAAELSVPGGRIVALGGGAVLSEQTRILLETHPVVLLMTTQDAVLRTANLSRRPLLRDDPQAWGRILEERRPFYEAVADVTYRTDRATKEQLARRVARWARGFVKPAGPPAAPDVPEDPVSGGPEAGGADQQEEQA